MKDRNQKPGDGFADLRRAREWAKISELCPESYCTQFSEKCKLQKPISEWDRLICQAWHKMMRHKAGGDRGRSQECPHYRILVALIERRPDDR